MASGINFSQTLSISATTQSSITAKLKFNGGVPFDANVKFYCKLSTATGWGRIYAKVVTKTSSEKTISNTFTSLLANRNYNVKAVITFFDQGGTVVTKTVRGKTATATGTLTLTPNKTSITAKLSGLGTNTGLERYIEWGLHYYRPLNYNSHGAAIEGSATYVPGIGSGTSANNDNDSGTASANGTQTASATIAGATYKTNLAKTASSGSKTMKNLASDTWYEVTAKLISGTAVLRTWTSHVKTLIREDQVPTAIINRVEQLIFEKKIRIYWESPAHIPGSTYIFLMAEGDAQTAEQSIATQVGVMLLGELTEEPSEGYTDFICNNDELSNGTYTFAIKSTNVEAQGVFRTSELEEAELMFTFEWDTPKQSGRTYNLTAAEWNKLIRWTAGCLEHRNIRYEVGDDATKYPMTEALPGEFVDNEMFNQVADAVEAAMATAVYVYDGGWTIDCLRPGDIEGLLVDRKDNGDAIKSYDFWLLEKGANNEYLKYAYADTSLDYSYENWLHPVSTADTGPISPTTGEIYVVVGECEDGSYWWFEDQYVALYRWNPGGWDEPCFEWIKDVYIYR